MKILLFALLLCLIRCPAGVAQITNPNIEFDHITYLTDKFDSLIASYSKAGYKITAGERSTFGLQSDFIWFEDGSYLEFQTTNTDDSTDWRFRAIRTFGTHVSSLGLRVVHLDSVLRELGDHSIDVGTNFVARLNCPDLGRQVSIKGCALKGPAPLDVVFIESERVQPPKEATSHANSVFRVDWLLLTASPDEEALLRQTFDALKIRKRHEGCCDYWMVGPSTKRIGIRFQLHQDTYVPLDNWLEIDNGAVIMAY